VLLIPLLLPPAILLIALLLERIEAYLLGAVDPCRATDRTSRARSGSPADNLQQAHEADPVQAMVAENAIRAKKQRSAA
jgi:hypothetical protein